ncbi:MAG TPA: hypothetical protein VJB61_21565 [Actinomycetota bacterium]
MTRQADLKRRVRARMAKTGESYAAARAQVLAGAQPPAGSEVVAGWERPGRDRLDASVHVTNGDITVDLLRRAGLARDALAWADVLHEGPVPAGLDDAGLRRARAEFLAGADGLDPAAVLRRFSERDQALAAGRDGEYVLWFEADLYDQLQIAQILATLGDLGVDPGRVTLVCIGEYPGIAHFGGLGELEPGQLPGLLDAATPLTAEALDLGAAAWAALRAPDPGGLGRIAASRSRELRFLGEAFDRLAREYPSTRDGLSLTERRTLAATPAEGATAGTVFGRLGEREARPYLGDLFFFGLVARLARARVPLLELDPPAGEVGAATRLRPTPAGRRVLRGEADQVALNGIDRWVGGVHLQGPEAPWRWDEGTESITGPAAR